MLPVNKVHNIGKGTHHAAAAGGDALKPSAALARGIYMVPQEPMLFPNMTVEENVLIGFKEKTAVLKKKLVQIMDDIGWHLDLTRKAMSLSIAEQQLVELLRGLLRESQVLILDEPTSALTFDEVESLFKIVKDLQSKGIGIVYITHRLAEVFEIATDVAIMRDGVVTLKGKVADFTREMLVKGLLPPNMDDLEEKEKCEDAALDYEKLTPVFELSDYSGYGFEDVNLKIYPGEILGVAGVVGAGRTELATTIFGRDKVLRGKAILDGQDVTGLSTAQVLKTGMPRVLFGSINDIIPTCIISLFVTFVMITGGIDIQAGSIVGLTSIVLGVSWQDWGLNIWMAALLAMLVAAVAGGI